MTDRRTYDDSCGTALALDLIGERWALLVIRELLLGGRRFGDLRSSLPGISANVLTQRLEGLEASGLVVRRKLPPPASVQVYELTEWGHEAEPIIMALGRWGARSPVQDENAPLSAVGMMLSFKAMFVSDNAGGVRMTVELRSGDDFFWVRISDRELTEGRGRAANPDLVLSGDPGAIVGAIYGLVSIDDMEASGALKIELGRGWFSRFATLFYLPPKVNSLDAA